MQTTKVRELLEAGVHFGHQTRRWNPKMKPFIFTARNGIYIIDLHKTITALARACDKVREIIGRGKEADETFEQAWQQQAENPLRRILKMDGRLRFAAGLAAGLAIGLILHFVLPLVLKPQSPSAPANMLTQNTGNQISK